VHRVNFITVYIRACGPGSSVGIATDYGLNGPGIKSRWRATFFAQVQAGPGAHPASCTMGTGSFPGVKWPGRGADHNPLPVPRLKMNRAIPVLPLYALDGLLPGELYILAHAHQYACFFIYERCQLVQ
jgi:hypothetical protein